MKPNNPNVIHLTKREFKEKVFDYTLSKDFKYKGDIPAVVDFYADWCMPCKVVAPILNELSEEYAGQIVVYKVNTEKEPQVSKAFGITSIPTLFFIPVGGKPIVVRGALPRFALKSNIKRILPGQKKSFFSKLFSLNS